MDQASVEGALGIVHAVDGFFLGEFTWTNGDVPEAGRAYVITIGGAARSQAGDFLNGNADGTGGTRTVSR